MNPFQNAGSVPSGGTSGQVLTKNSDAAGDAGWSDPVTGVAQIPAVSGPSSGDELHTVDFSVTRADGTGYSAGVEFAVEAVRISDGVDVSASFAVSAPNASTLRLALPGVDADMAVALRFRAREGLLGYSPGSEAVIFTVLFVDVEGDNAAEFTAASEDWPHQETGAASSKTVAQGEAETGWAKLAGIVNFDATADELTVDSFGGETLVFSGSASGMLASGDAVIIKPSGSDTCAFVTLGGVVESGSGSYVYTCTGLSPEPASVDQAWFPPVVRIGSGGDGELIVPSMALTVDSHDGVSLTVTYAVSGLLAAEQHPNIMLNGMIANTIANVGTETDNGDDSYTATITLSADPGETVTTAVIPSRFPDVAEVFSACSRFDLIVYGTTSTAYQERTTRTGSAGADINVDTSFSLAAGTKITHLGLFQSSTEGAYYGALHIVLDNGATVTSVASVSMSHTGDNTVQYAELSTPYVVPDVGTYRVASHTTVNSVTLCSGSRLYIGTADPYIVGDTSGTGSSDATQSPAVAYKALDSETHDRLTVSTAERSLDALARAVALRVERSLASGDQTYAAAVNLWKEEA